MLKRVGRLLVLSVVAAGIACSDVSAPVSAPLSVSPQASQQSLLGGLLGTVTQTLSYLLVSPIERTTPLANDITWSFTAGPAGATSHNPGVGLSIVIPPYALSSTQIITVTALKGADIAYKFGPHGLQFARKVVLTQDLRNTTADALLGLLSTSDLQGAYFASDRPETTSDGLVKVTELLSGVSSLLSNTFSFSIVHFSGYIVASGRGGDIDVAY